MIKFHFIEAKKILYEEEENEQERRIKESYNFEDPAEIYPSK